MIVGGTIAMVSMQVVMRQDVAGLAGCAYPGKWDKSIPKNVKLDAVSVGGTIIGGTEMYAAYQKVWETTQES